jgi:hypothetical protein
MGRNFENLVKFSWPQTFAMLTAYEEKKLHEGNLWLEQIIGITD